MSAGRLKVLYVPGNHDFMLRLSPALRREVQAFLSLANDPKKPFPTEYLDAKASVYATHGHTYDRVNHHRAPEGHWAFGDAIVLRVVNRFQSAVCTALGCGIETKLGRQLADIDNVEPLWDVPIYVRWLSEQLKVASQRKKLIDVWRQVVQELLALPEFLDDAYGGREIAATRSGLRLSRELGLAKLVVSFRQLLPDLERDYSLDATGIAGSAPYRFVVFGHTHEPAMIPLPVQVGNQSAYYVNTGSWRRVVCRPGGSAGPFTGVRVRGRFVVHRESAAVAGGRYQLQREWRTT